MRQLAAILFADMTGYTSLMQENEQLARLKRKRLKEVLESTIGQFNGRILQNYGDGSLSIFSSAIDAFIVLSKFNGNYCKNQKWNCAWAFIPVM